MSPEAYGNLGGSFGIGVYMADYHGNFHGSYGVTHGNSKFITAMGDDFVKGIIKSGVYVPDAHDPLDYNGNLPPIDKNGNFTAFEGKDIPIQKW